MTFSVIMPIYNVEKYLDDCLRSLQRQTFGDYEVVCINDGSTDGSREMLSEWEHTFPQMRVIDRENGGLSAARNTGLDAAEGEYVVFVDSDDWVEPNMLARLAEEANGTDMLCFACRRTDNHASDALPVEESDGWSYFNRHALDHRTIPFVCVWQRGYRRQFLLENSLHFRESILHEDNEFTPRACLAAKNVKVISDVLYNYRVRPGSIMTSRGLKSKESLITIGNELSTFFSLQQGIDKSIVYQSLTQCYQMAFINNSLKEDHFLRPLVDWKAYRRVSRTKLRHRIQYAALTVSPLLFRIINAIL